MTAPTSAPTAPQSAPGADAAPPVTPAPASSEHAPRIGRTGQPVRALVFAGGLFDSVMQLGVTHALLVSRACPPDVVVGVSTGAVNAVALADIMQAGSTLTDSDKTVEDGMRMEARVARFRQVLDAYRQSHEDVFNAFVPDVYQVDGHRPLEPTRLPIHNREERRRREEAVNAQAGLIRLANDILRIDVSLGEVTRGVRAYLGWRAAGEQRKPYRRVLWRLHEGFRLWWRVVRNMNALSLLGFRLLHAALAPYFDRLADWLEIAGARLGSREGWVRRTMQAVAGAGARLVSRMGTGESSDSAAGLVFKSRFIRYRAAVLGRWIIGMIVLAPVAIVPMIIVAASAGGVYDYVSHQVGRGTGLESLFPTARLFARPLLHFDVLRGFAAAMAMISALWGLFIYFLIARAGVDGVLAVYHIDDGLLDPHPLRSWFVRLFDPLYYGRVEMSEVVEAAFTESTPVEAGGKPKRLSDYEAVEPKIHTRPLAANVETSRLEALAGDTPVVDALLAATAKPPFFEAHRCSDAWYVDGAVVANEPTRALVTHLTDLVNDDASRVDVYPVTSLPIDSRHLGSSREEYTNAVDVVQRARQLESFRDATLDRQMTDLVTQTLPGDAATWWMGRQRGESPRGPKRIRANVYPIELDHLKSLTEKILSSQTVEERRTLIATAVADGCRSSLEVMLHSSLQVPNTVSLPCRKHLGERLGHVFLPGSSTDARDGPGLPEVCRACSAPIGRNGETRVRQALRTNRERHSPLPLWPCSDTAVVAPAGDTTQPTIVVPPKADDGPRTTQWPARSVAWPSARDGQSGRERPTINLLFSGGVFRGVYLVGVINAMNECHVRPDVIAGSSIGSITAAMAARIFAETEERARKRHIADVAATYMAVDRLVLTDRFSDFIRNFTLRASAADFSLRHLDTAFRAFDRPSSAAYSKDVRRVLAGIERLFYVSPFETHALVKAARMRRYSKVKGLLELYAQEWLERGSVGFEILGAEPLSILIRDHVLRDMGDDIETASAGFLKTLEQRGIQFIATTSNIKRGTLDVAHLPAITTEEIGTRLVDTLLASSAFPAIFRPRWSWEVNPRSTRVEQLIDGGVMDNLPLDAVAKFLDGARRDGRVSARPGWQGSERPGVPHLLFAGSLEVGQPRAPSPAEVARMARHWRRTMKRAKQLSYNNKIDNYAEAQSALREIYEDAQRRSDGKQPASSYEPLNLEVAVVKPRWLCGTFAFHPMLGFKRREQARSIAHGCWSTLERVHDMTTRYARWLDAWGMTPPAGWRRVPNPRPEHDGDCWYRTGATCPFSDAGIRQSQGATGVKPETRRMLTMIYEECGKSHTHRLGPVDMADARNPKPRVSLPQTPYIAKQ